MSYSLHYYYISDQ